MAAMKVPYVDLGAHNGKVRAELLEAVGRVLDHGWFVLGPEVTELEKRLAERLDVPHVVSVHTGTDALVLALRVAGIGPGDEVITVSHSFVSTATAIRLVGAVPVFVDVDEGTMQMDAGRLEAARTVNTRAVLPVHLGGFACDMGPIVAFCNEHGLTIIEDCAQSLGATSGGRAVGSFGLGCFSLHPLKVLSACGDGGFIAVADDDVAEELRQLRNNGLRDRDHVAHVSANSRLDTVQAAMLLVKERHLDAWIDARRAHAAAYREALEGVVRLPPEEAPDSRAVYSTFVIRVPDRDGFQAALKADGVDAKVHYPIPIHLQLPFAPFSTPLPVTERVVSEILSLPVTPELDEAGRSVVIDAVRRAARERS